MAALFSCKAKWEAGKPYKLNNITVALILPSLDPDGTTAAQIAGFRSAQNLLGLKENQLIIVNNVDVKRSVAIEEALRAVIKDGANLIIAASPAYMDDCAEFADEFKNVIFVCYGGSLFNETNLTNYAARDYQAHYLCGIAAAELTQNGKIGFLATNKTINPSYYSAPNAFALGVERIMPAARIYINDTSDCDIVAQYNGVWDRRGDKNELITFIEYNWEIYYQKLLQSIVEGTFNSMPYYGGLAEGVVAIMPLAETYRDVQNEISPVRQAIIDNSFGVFDGFLLTNDGNVIGGLNATLDDASIRSQGNWFYHNIINE
jgi:basic membrane protein A